MTHYLILSDASGNWRKSPDLLSEPMEPRRPSEPGAPKITRGDFSATELRELAQAPDMLAMAPVINTRLIEPEPLDDLRGDEVAPFWGLGAVRADDTDVTGAGARLAILDTGLDTKHPSFDGVRLNLRDFAGTGIEDANGHGTHLAGTVLGRDTDGQRISVAPGVDQVMVGKALSDDGRGKSDAFLDSFLWALRGQANIIAFALRFDMGSYAEQLLEADYPMTLAQSHAILAYRGNLRIFETILRMVEGTTAPLVLGAVGNDSRRMISPEFETGPAAPSAARRVLSVGAVAPSETGYVAASFSNLGPKLAAPGVGIGSAASGGGTRILNGSSMALAHATGVAALWYESLSTRGSKIDGKVLARHLCDSAVKDGMRSDQSVLDIGCGLVQAP